ncbi:ribosomal protein S18-alanine N-acetyltransferase [Halomonas salinarum]|uniref:ribosomal protein S18-alanine N-acetyltransferase n=1 Tax=Halomonas salinarum TaxID=1158993 RepID=UPI001FD77269|nr:ribosomal protein S18-alanine N-acetyltransferase [Halomonas salinarum]
MSAMSQVVVLTPDWHDAVVSVEEAGQPHPWSVDQLAKALEADDHEVVGMQRPDGEAGSLVGFAVLARLPFEAELQAITVAASARRQGVARALLERLIATASHWGSERLLLEVRESNAPALALYRGLGFVAEGRRRGYYPALAVSAPREDALLMALTL